jgi:hypothetical protein
MKDMKTRFGLTQITAFFMVSFLVFIVSCGKEKSTSGTDEQELEVTTVSAQSDAEAESTFTGLFDDVLGVNNDVGVAGSGVFFGRPDTLTPVARCFTLTITHPNGTPFPAHVIVDFGTSGCTGPDGHVRKGKMIIDYTNRLIYPGAVATTTFDGFYVDNNKVEGTHTISNISIYSPPAAFIPTYQITVVNGKLTKPNGNYTEWNSTRTVTQIEGYLTLDFPRDDVFKIEGSANGLVRTSTLAVRWESTITEPLIRRFTCRWIVKGRVRTVRMNLPAGSPWVGILDFGTGGCDNQATLTINGVAHQITLP